MFYRLTLEMRAKETYRPIHKDPLLLFDFNQNRNVSTYFRKAPQFQKCRKCHVRIKTIGETPWMVESTIAKPLP